MQGENEQLRSHVQHVPDIMAMLQTLTQENAALKCEVQQMAVKLATPAPPVMQPYAAQTPHAHGAARPYSPPSMPDPLSLRHHFPAVPIPHLTDQFRGLSVSGEPGYTASDYGIPPPVYQSCQRQYSQPWFHPQSVSYQMGSGTGFDQGPRLQTL